jgi:hypothetical protein
MSTNRFMDPDRSKTYPRRIFSPKALEMKPERSSR